MPPSGPWASGSRVASRAGLVVAGSEDAPRAEPRAGTDPGGLGRFGSGLPNRRARGARTRALSGLLWEAPGVGGEAAAGRARGSPASHSSSPSALSLNAHSLRCFPVHRGTRSLSPSFISQRHCGVNTLIIPVLEANKMNRAARKPAQGAAGGTRRAGGGI